MYAPSIDKMKAVEMNIAQQKHKNPVRPKALLRQELSDRRNMSINKSYQDLGQSSHARSSSDVSGSLYWHSSYKPTKQKRNPLVPVPPQAKTEAKIIDYLGERRQAR